MTTPTPLDSAMERIKQCAQGNSSFPWVELSRNEAAALLARLEEAERLLLEHRQYFIDVGERNPEWVAEIDAYRAPPTQEKQG